MYSLYAFGTMMRDEVRMDAYAEALRRTVKPGSVVIDIGTGTGIFAFIACQLGAAHVYAVEPNSLIDIGKQMSAHLGFSDRITFIKDLTTNINLPQQADVIVGDIRGQVPLMRGIFSTYADARTRLLKPGGVLIPQRDTLSITLIEDAQTYETELLSPWMNNPYGLVMPDALPFLLNKALPRTFTPTVEQMLVPGAVWAIFNYGDTINPHIGEEVHWTVEKAGTAHFIHLWFDAVLMEGVEIVNAPGAKRARVYGSITFPLSEPLPLEPGNLVSIDLRADPAGNGFVYRWVTRLYPNGDCSQKPAKQFIQSTFFSQILSDSIKRTVTYKPRLSGEGEITAFILELMRQGSMTLEEIARKIMERHPNRVNDFDEALARAAVLSQGYSE